MEKSNRFWKIIAVVLVIILYLFALNGRYEFSSEGIYDKWRQRGMYYIHNSAFKWQGWAKKPKISSYYENNTSKEEEPKKKAYHKKNASKKINDTTVNHYYINKDKFKELYKQVTSIGGFKYTEDELMNAMQKDSSVAKKLYNYSNDRINVKLLDAADEEHFLEMIYFKQKYNPEKAKKLYKEITSITKIESTEQEFYQKLNDPTYVEKVYDRFRTKYNTFLLGATDLASFNDSLEVKQ